MLSRWPRRCRRSTGLSPLSLVSPSWLGGLQSPASARSGGTQGVSSHGAGENVRDFFFRVAALTFENSVLAELERGSSARRIGDTVRE